MLVPQVSRPAILLAVHPLCRRNYPWFASLWLSFAVLSNSISRSLLLRPYQTSIPLLFSNELEYLSTGKNSAEAFEFLFDTEESRKDLVFM
jgi:hypothetical protein